MQSLYNAPQYNMDLDVVCCMWFPKNFTREFYKVNMGK